MKVKENIVLLMLPGLIAAGAVSFLGFKLSRYHPLLDGFFIAFIGAILLRNLVRRQWFFAAGAALCKDILIPVGLLLYGTQINWLTLTKPNPSIFIISLATTLTYFAIIFLCNRFVFGITNNKLTYLNSGANAICGVSATAVYIPFVDAKEDEVTSTLLAVVITGVLSVFATWFFIQQNLQLSTQQYATLCGVTLNQTGAVKASAAFMGKEAVTVAATIKAFRTSLILPVALLLMVLTRVAGGTAEKMSKELQKSAVGYGIFIAVLFFGASLLFSFTPLAVHTKAVEPWFKILFGMTIAGVGLMADMKKVINRQLLFNSASSIIGWMFAAGIAIILILRLI